MIKCEKCGYTNDNVMVPMICPDCGNIAKPYVMKEIEIEENVIAEEEITLEKFED